MSYKLFIDDIRQRHHEDRYDETISEFPPGDWITARSSNEAIEIVKKNGIPTFLGLDHDLGMVNGKKDTVMVFLRWIENETDLIQKNDPPEFYVHSANPVGAANIRSFMDSWKKFRSL